MRKPGLVRRLARNSTLRRWIPRGSPFWYPYYFAKELAQSIGNRGAKRKKLFYTIHNNILLDDFHAIYFYIPKVACSTLKRVCAGLLGLEANRGDLIEEIHLVDFPYAKKYKVKRAYKDYFKFSFVRNPWSRLVSCYKDKLDFDKGHAYERYDNRFVAYLRSMDAYTEGMTFERFVEVVCSIPDEDAESHFESQHRFITDERGDLLVDFIGRFEKLEEDFKVVADRLKTSVEIPHLRRTRHVDHRDYYSDRTARMVARRFERDIELFKYTI